MARTIVPGSYTGYINVAPKGLEPQRGELLQPGATPQVQVFMIVPRALP